jgi:predicted patatin/cPLA2 family phospholipase
MGNTLVIRPEEKLPIGHISHNPEEMHRVYELGRRIGEARMADIDAFMR